MTGQKEFLNILNNVVTERQSEYDVPEVNFKRIADFWKLVDTCPHAEAKIAIMFILTKITRLLKTPDKLDSWVDIAGYAMHGAKVTEAK